MPYITPSTTPASTVRRCLFIPDEPLWLAAVNGALTELTKMWNWEDIDGITPAEAVTAAQAMIDTYFSGECMETLGMIVPFGRATALPEGWLEMDGSTYDSADYPDLAAVLPGLWLFNSGQNFTLPNMQHRTAVGAEGSGVYEVGQDGGEEKVALSVANLAAHTHPPLSPTTAFLGSVASGGGGNVVGGTTFQLASTTGSTGSGSPHENMPPYIALVWGISWR